MPSSTRFRLTLGQPRALALTLHLGIFTAPLLIAQPVLAQQQAKHYAIPAGPLGDVLSRYAREAGVDISFAAAQVSTLKSQGLQGHFSVDEGFAVLLRGHALRAQSSVDGYLLVSAPTTGLELGPTTISEYQDSGTTEGTGSYTTGATRTATKLPLSLRETPQSVSVITRQLMDDQQLSTINQVLAFTPGISTNHRDSERYTFYSRGFAIQNFQYDGVPSQVANESQQYTSALSDMAIYDRVEVLRGATGPDEWCGYAVGYHQSGAQASDQGLPGLRFRRGGDVGQVPLRS
ncbi:MAG: TonB-dependent receptor plug domain-containing protein [Candidatus Pseudomonas colombiensis]|nr:MAG: TonB-dependent receptor plug domain-containing protein [Pseudomonas sp.]